MLRLTDDESRAFAAAVGAAGDVASADVAAIYADFERDLAVVRPRCDASGACCRFEAYGHRLFITTIEMASFARTVRVEADALWDGTGCPYQTAGRCGAHAARPFGCRVYFCDESSTDWQRSQYERMHERLRRLHDVHRVPYFYVEWRAALAACGLARAAPVSTRRIVLTAWPAGR